MVTLAFVGRRGWCSTVRQIERAIVEGASHEDIWICRGALVLCSDCQFLYFDK